ncbi:hypothetical protein Tco_0454362, partial [Tanacetum coccineum]
MQAVPPPMTWNYLPSGPEIEIDDSQYSYGPEEMGLTKLLNGEHQGSRGNTAMPELHNKMELLRGEMNMNLIEPARTMLADSFLPNTFWAEAVSTACYGLTVGFLLGILYKQSEVPFEQQPDPSPRPSPRPSPKPSPTPIVPDSIPEPTGENLGDHSSSDTSLSGNEDDMTLQNVYDLCLSLCKQVSDQAKEIQALKAQITKLKKQAKPVIKHHKAYLKSVSLQQRFPRKSFSKKHRVHKESVSKQGRKIAKGESSVQRNPLFDEMPEDTVDNMDTENAQDEGRTREVVDEDKEIEENALSTEEVLCTDFGKVSTDRPI